MFKLALCNSCRNLLYFLVCLLPVKSGSFFFFVQGLPFLVNYQKKPHTKPILAMELYGRNSGGNGSQSGAQSEWSPVPAETGLEDSMSQLGLGNSLSYPERHGVPHCVFYMRTGYCGYGSRCRYNHPRDRAAIVEAVRTTGEYPERVGEPECQYYLKTGACKFGASCKFHHPKHRGGYLNQSAVNILGYPLRPGEKECSYYLKTGRCKFALTCKFHHPQPAGSLIPASAPQFYSAVQSPSVPLPEQYGASNSLRVARPPILTGSYMQGAYGPVLLSPGVVPIPGWNPYSSPLSPVLSPDAQNAAGATSLYGMTQVSSTPTFGRGHTPVSYAGPSSSSQKEQVFPERPGEPECQYYMRTGDCKFGLSCRFHHPQDRIITSPMLSPLGLPLRPGAQPCAFYMQNGLCKFGPTCKFDHPVGTVRYSPSASSLDFPVTPLVGSLLSTLAPSSTAEFRPELISRSKKESYSTRMSSTGNTSSTPVSLIFSQSGPVSLSDVQLSNPSSAPKTRSTRQGELRRSS